MPLNGEAAAIVEQISRQVTGTGGRKATICKPCPRQLCSPTHKKVYNKDNPCDCGTCVPKQAPLASQPSLLNRKVLGIQTKYLIAGAAAAYLLILLT